MLVLICFHFSPQNCEAIKCQYFILWIIGQCRKPTLMLSSNFFGNLMPLHVFLRASDTIACLKTHSSTINDVKCTLRIVFQPLKKSLETSTVSSILNYCRNSHFQGSRHFKSQLFVKNEELVEH